MMVTDAMALYSQTSLNETSTSGWNFHFQQTIISQYHPNFSAMYSSINSLDMSKPAQTSITSTFFFGGKLWNGAEIYCNPELGGGSGLSGATGIAGSPNGETYRIGNPAPQITVARLFIRQTFSLVPIRIQFLQTM